MIMTVVVVVVLWRSWGTTATAHSGECGGSAHDVVRTALNVQWEWQWQHATSHARSAARTRHTVQSIGVQRWSIRWVE